MTSIKSHAKVGITYCILIILFAAFASITVTRNEDTVPVAPAVSITQEDGTTAEVKSEAMGELAKYYKTIDELITDSEVIVFGRFEGQPTIVPPKIDKEPYDPGRRELTFRPIQTLKGDVKATIKVAQREGISEGGAVGSSNFPLFKSGENYVLFLVPTLHEEEFGEFYWVTGAIQGALRAINDKVYSLNVTGEVPQEVGPKVEGQPLHNFLVTLQGKIGPNNSK